MAQAGWAGGRTGLEEDRSELYRVEDPTVALGGRAMSLGVPQGRAVTLSTLPGGLLSQLGAIATRMCLLLSFSSTLSLLLII